MSGMHMRMCIIEAASPHSERCAIISAHTHTIALRPNAFDTHFPAACIHLTLCSSARLDARMCECVYSTHTNLFTLNAWCVCAHTQMWSRHKSASSSSAPLLDTACAVLISGPDKCTLEHLAVVSRFGCDVPGCTWPSNPTRVCVFVFIFSCSRRVH